MTDNASATPPAAPAPVASTPSTETAAPATQEPGFIQARLDRERRAVLKDLGIKVKKDEDPAEKIKEYKASKEERKKERQELRSKLEENQKVIERLSQSEAAVKVFAEMEFNQLTDEQKKLVETAAGSDPAERIKVIALMKATQPTPAAAVKEEKPIPAPAQTAPAAAAPPPADSQTPDVRQEYLRLKSTNPLLAAAHLLQHQHEFYKQP